MNGKRAKAIRRLEKALEQEKLAFQEMLRRSTPVPVKTMSMDDFNKGREKAAGIGVIATTPRTPDSELPFMDTDLTDSDGVYTRGITGLADLLGEDTSSRKSLLSSGLMDNLEPGAASAANKQSRENLDRMHESMNGPEAYAKIGSMGSKA